MTGSSALSSAEIAAIRPDFPVLTRTLEGGRPLVYLDSAATAQRPRVVDDAMRDFSEHHNAAVHRGAHQLAAEATAAYEGARAAIAAFVGAAPGELVFTSGTTGAINLLVAALTAGSIGGGGRGRVPSKRFALLPGDRIVVTQAEHHSNLVPWQRLAALTGAELAWLRVDAQGRVRTDDLAVALTPRTALVAFTHASNVSGAVSD
ncbi:MAG: aminotransferase class V-fold PLP-dependent enzyme, partial [Bifidobacteriaceae bacterium]|nr:aminotransferase class V-fold PLP-dependent enzyme [Bifidobacteriaceae bacterium]